MKKITLMLLAFVVTFNFNSHAAEGVIDLSGKTITDMDGTVWDLGQLQADGKTIIFDFWATWCGPCIGSIPGLDDIWSTHGPDGDNTIMVFSVEEDAGTSDEAATITAEGITTPVFIGEDNTDINSNMFAYTGSIPYFTVVCPSGYWQDRTGGIGSDGTLLTSLADACVSPVPSSDGMSFKLVANVAAPCPGTPSNSWSPEYTLANLGTSTITEAVIEVKLGSTVIELINWTGSLAPANTEVIAISAIEFYGMNNQEVEVNIHTVNGAEDSNSANDSKIVARGTGIADEATVVFELDHDIYADEIGWEIRSSNNTLIASLAVGTYATGDVIPAQTITLPTINDCYSVFVEDDFGDGIGEGFKITQGSKVILNNTTDFDDDMTDFFYYSDDSDGDGVNDAAENLSGTDPNSNTDVPSVEIAAYADNDNDGFSNAVETSAGSDPDKAASTPYKDAVGIKDVTNVTDFTVFPNPTSDFINVTISSNSSAKITVELVDVLGRTLETVEANNGSAKFNVSDYNKGIYLVNVISNGKSIATSSVVVK